jgi:gliding motility-associated lipoprotein GldD
MCICILSFVFMSCEERKIYVPKQKGYFRIDFPERSFQPFSGNYPYSFMLPTYAHVVPDTLYNAEPYWFNIVYPQFNAIIHMSYKNITNNLDVFVDDAHFFVFKHDIKADAIRSQEFAYEHKDVHGLLFDIRGDAASVMQFYVTDSLNHFVRGALYFNVPPNKDSLAPVIQFMRDDIIELISSFEWNSKFSKTN